ncbi:MAG: hypothetical protein CMC53_03660 [Flavobacteriaceae bacterium]|nr:hypothetical protein [Flavobacteriaceae bacterium]
MLVVVFFKNISSGPDIQTIKVSNNKQQDVNAKFTDIVNYNFDVKPILSDKCYTCHGPDDKARQADLRLDFVNGISDFLNNDTNHSIIDLNNPQSSEIIKRIYSNDKGYFMPPPESNLKLSVNEKEILKKWIEQGAKWDSHWSYNKPEYPKPPETSHSAWINNEIDNFISKKFDQKGLIPSEPASKEILLRRVFFDIIGLPPSIEQIDSFLEDNSEDSYEKVVDRLLSSESYGERMASIWMDLSRYGDSHGYQDDTERVMWPWRDWVIHAYNKNLSYDKFMKWQIAGDMIPNATKEQILASGFNRNHKITQEGGVIDEEYRVEYVADRTITTSKIMMGLTLECARCHTHKYDPITHDEFFSFYSFFNNIDEKGQIPYGVTAPKPNMTVKKEDTENDLSFVKLPDSLDNVTLMVMKESDKLRKTYVLNRGRYDSPTNEVKPNTPEIVLPFDDTKYSKNRLGLSQWFFDPENPLTSRVVVNRIWQQFFGVGIVSTPDDFGSQGSKPFNPELLDWLAYTYQNHDKWDTKKFIKRIVMSSTYRQSSKINYDNQKIDADNTYLANYPRQKLTAEMIRDNALASSGMLVNKIGGPSVKPMQPEGLWNEVIGGGGGSLAFYVPDSGENLFRRSLYTFWKRTVPPPSMMIFDAPTRDDCVVVRQKTSTPLQSLALMNDPQYLMAAEHLSNKIFEKKLSQTEKIIKLYRTITSRSPNNFEINRLKDYIKDFQQTNNTDERDAFISLTQLIYNLDETTQKS